MGRSLRLELAPVCRSMGQHGSPVQEGIIKIGVMSLVPAMLLACIIVLWGLRGANGPKLKGAS
jgi:hypothetical protein